MKYIIKAVRATLSRLSLKLRDKFSDSTHDKSAVLVTCFGHGMYCITLPNSDTVCGFVPGSLSAARQLVWMIRASVLKNWVTTASSDELLRIQGHLLGDLPFEYRDDEMLRNVQAELDKRSGHQIERPKYLRRVA